MQPLRASADADIVFEVGYLRLATPTHAHTMKRKIAARYDEVSRIVISCSLDHIGSQQPIARLSLLCNVSDKMNKGRIRSLCYVVFWSR